MSNLDKINKYILEQVQTGKMDEAMAIQVLKELNKAGESRSDDIAVIGMACKFPGAGDINEFWNNIKTGSNSIGELPGVEESSRKPLKKVQTKMTRTF